jgi:hypothetical protein
MLLFELFPAFVMLVALAAGVGLFIANLQASRDPSEQQGDVDQRPSKLPPSRTEEGVLTHDSRRA